jgi:hypothetical protein
MPPDWEVFCGVVMSGEQDVQRYSPAVEGAGRLKLANKRNR